MQYYVLYFISAAKNLKRVISQDKYNNSLLYTF